MLRGWLELPESQGDPFWAVNLMKYRDLADYADGRETTLTGKEADDLYAPHGPIEAVGGMVAFGADVADQLAGSPVYDRVAIVRYPSRAAFFEMQQREDFQELHAHKDAGMEFTTVIACEPDRVESATDDSDAALLMRVRRLADGAEPPGELDDLVPMAHFACEGVIVGDERKWDQVLFDLAPPAVLDGGGILEGTGVEDEIVMVLGSPLIDALVESVERTAD